MSKIQINELNQNASEFEVLNGTETAEVVGGYYYYPSYSSYYSSSDDDFVVVDQDNFNYTNQLAVGGGFKSNTSNYNSTSQSNSANVYA